MLNGSSNQESLLLRKTYKMILKEDALSDLNKVILFSFPLHSLEQTASPLFPVTQAQTKRNAYFIWKGSFRLFFPHIFFVFAPLAHIRTFLFFILGNKMRLGTVWMDEWDVWSDAVARSRLWGKKGKPRASYQKVCFDLPFQILIYLK